MALLSTNTANTAKSWGAAFLATAFMAANVNAQASKDKELSEISLNAPIPSGTCVADSREGTAFEKLKTIMAARKQTSVLVGNRAVAATSGDSPYKEIVLTSNLVQGGEGYEVTSTAPLGKIAKGYCFSQNKEVYVFSVFNEKAGVPLMANKGELGVALTNANRVGSKVALVALTSSGTLKVVNFNPDTGKGGLLSADGKGENALPLAALTDIGYSSRIPTQTRKSWGLPVDDAIALNNNPEIVAAAPNLTLQR